MCVSEINANRKGFICANPSNGSNATIKRKYFFMLIQATTLFLSHATREVEFNKTLKL